MQWYQRRIHGRLSDPDNQMVLSIDSGSFCDNICLDMRCGALPCDAAKCQSECNVSLDNKLNVNGFMHYEESSSSSSSSSSEEEAEELQGYHHGHHGHHG